MINFKKIRKVHTSEKPERWQKMPQRRIRNAISLDWMNIYLPGKTWIHDKPFGKRSGKSYRIRPDYLCEEEKIIIEFDGLQHYTNPANIRKDRKNQAIYEGEGFKVIRIPYFINLTKEVIKEMFGITVIDEKFDPAVPSMSAKWSNTPAYCCYQGIMRMAEEFKRYPQQYKVNIDQLEADNDEELSGAELLKAAMKGKLF